MVERQLSEYEGRGLLERLKEAGMDTPTFWWEISAVQVDWAYAQMAAHHIGGEARTRDTWGEENTASEAQENLDEELQREIVVRVMREEVQKLKERSMREKISADGLAKMESFVQGVCTSLTEVESFAILGKPVGLFGLKDYEGSHLGKDPTGTSLWMSGLVMCKVLEQRSGHAMFSACKLVELGAGLGLPGLMAHRLGCSDVTITDCDDTLVSLIEINAAGMHIEGPGGHEWDGDVISLPVKVAPYSYGENAEYLGGPFDLVLCSDLVYLTISDESLKAIVSSCLQLTAQGGEVLVVNGIRPASHLQLDRFTLWMEEQGFNHLRLAVPADCPAIAQKSVEIHSFHRK